jgi:nonribosomal peptide synthetase protein BlmV
MLFANPTVAELVQEIRRLQPDDVVTEGQTSSAHKASVTRIPLTALQQGMVFHAVREPERSAYVCQVCCRMSGKPDRDALVRAYAQLGERHTVLRAAVDLSEPLIPALRVDASATSVVEFVEVEAAAAHALNDAFEQFLQRDMARGFDLHTPPLARLSVVTEPGDSWQCVWTHHHVILDGWSQQILLREFLELYHGRALEPPATTYADYVAWLASTDQAASMPFWREYLHDCVPSMLPKQTSTVGSDGHVERMVDRLLEERLRMLAQRQRVTLALVFEAAWALVLSEVLGSRDVVFGMTATVRPSSLRGADRVVGVCINTLPLRVRVPTESSVVEWLAELWRAYLEWNNHAHSALAHILRDTASPKPAFNTLLVIENLPPLSARPAGPDETRLTHFRFDVREDYPLVLVVTPGAWTSFTLKYLGEQFSAAQVRHWLDLFIMALEALATEAGVQSVVARVAGGAKEEAERDLATRRAHDRQRLLAARRARHEDDAR